MVYLDNAATTPVFREVLDRLPFYYQEYFSNPSSIHREGQKARHLVEKSRFNIATVLGCSEEELFFASSGTESNNTVLFGLADTFASKKHILLSPIEHKSVLIPGKKLVSKGFVVEFLKVDEEGVVDLDHLKRSITDKTLLVAVLHGNNETGVLQDIEVIGRICRERGVFFFTDAVQSFMKEDINLDFVDFLSISGHKINAPKGIGVLYKRKGIQISPLIYGGGQEKGLRSGTENVQLIASLWDAIKVWLDNKHSFREKLLSLKNRFEDTLIHEIPEVRIVSKGTKRLPNISTVIFPKVDAQSLLIALSSEGVYVSSGSACSSGTPTPSHVLLAMGYSEREALSSLRFSFGVMNSLEDVDTAVDKLKSVYKNLSLFF
ncbi:MAG: cysteine desulfurase [Hydrogenothermaceae bacterium]|nr:cysteine desulfurase [Hydrogenothermaceae bacterium]